ncbi:MAG: shikimate kinase [Hyphomicrobiales bacterium]
MAVIAHFPDRMLGMQVGRKVKCLRQENALTRKQLAEKTTVSERYIGQLENGQANVSLNVLSRIVGELGVPITNVLPGGNGASAHEPLNRLIGTLNAEERERAFNILSNHFSKAEKTPIGIALVGLRGAGKSTLGQGLSNLSSVPFCRLTALATNDAGMTLAELMELVGQNGFRRLEFEALKKLIDETEIVILETSGGVVADEETYDLVRQHFTTVWVKASAEEHMQRVIDQNDLRPMSGRSSAMSDLKALLAEREGAYSKADHVLDTTGRSERDCLGELAEIAGEVFARKPAL